VRKVSTTDVDKAQKIAAKDVVDDTIEAIDTAIEVVNTAMEVVILLVK